MKGFWLITGLCLIVLMSLSAIPQDQAYHDFADQRQLLGIEHFWNVVSNLPFLLVGYIGLKALQDGDALHFPKPLLNCYWVFFFGVFATGIGSMYYHLQPNNETLLWDRLPMTIAFMAFFSLIIGEYIDENIDRQVLLPLLLLGITSVFYWYTTETAGNGDLRPYAFVHFAPMLLIPYILLTQPVRYSHQHYVWAMLLTYLAAKIFEALDDQVYFVGELLSGHSIKHMCAALGPYVFLLGLKQRQPIVQAHDKV